MSTNVNKEAFQPEKVNRQKTEKRKLKGDAKLAAKKFGDNFKSFSNFKISSNDVIIDGIFGSGLKKNISGNLKKIIEKSVKDYARDIKMRRFPSLKNVYK